MCRKALLVGKLTQGHCREKRKRRETDKQGGAKQVPYWAGERCLCLASVQNTLNFSCVIEMCLGAQIQPKQSDFGMLLFQTYPGGNRVVPVPGRVK